jgi:hypothetical protein
MTVELIPVIEISFPKSVLDKAGNTPPIPYLHHLDEWEVYRKTLLELFGLSQYQPFKPGHSFYPVLQFTNIDDLKKILDQHLLPLKEHGQAITETCALFGGTVLIINDEVKLLPQCCGTLSDFLDWKRVLEDDFKSDYIFMGGHPSPKAIKKNKELVLECIDEEEDFYPLTESVISIDILPLMEAVQKAEKELLIFSKTVDRLSKEYAVDNLSKLFLW